MVGALGCFWSDRSDGGSKPLAGTYSGAAAGSRRHCAHRGGVDDGGRRDRARKVHEPLDSRRSHQTNAPIPPKRQCANNVYGNLSAKRTIPIGLPLYRCGRGSASRRGVGARTEVVSGGRRCHAKWSWSAVRRRCWEGGPPRCANPIWNRFFLIRQTELSRTRTTPGSSAVFCRRRGALRRARC